MLSLFVFDSVIFKLLYVSFHLASAVDPVPAESL